MPTAILVLALSLAYGIAEQGSRPPDARVQQLVEAAVAQTRTPVTYDASYRRIACPGGDVPETIGVSTDVVIRTAASAWTCRSRSMLFRYTSTGHYRYRLR